MTPFSQSTERSVRKEAPLVTNFFVTHEAGFDAIYDEMVQVRDTIAKSLGFANYAEFADVKMNRWDYNRSMIETYRKEILEKVVPAIKFFTTGKPNRIT